MQKKPFMFAILVLLLAQPFVIVSSIPFAQDTIAQINTTEAITQSAGSRLDPEDYTQHVPIVIDEDADFVTQGWPGSGTDVDPFVISGLNITYDYADYLIKITNTDEYFVIEDCFLRQLSSSSSILIENVSHATIRYITIMSESGGIEAVNADGTYIHYVHVESIGDYCLYANEATDLNLYHSLYNSTSYNAVWINASKAAVIGESIFDSDWPHQDLVITYSDYVNLYNVEFHISSTELSVSHCNFFFADGLLSTEGDYGIQLYNCNDSVIQDADITSEYSAMTMYFCENITVTDSVFSDNAGSQTIYVYSSNEVSFYQILVNDTSGDGILAFSSPFLSVTHSVLSHNGDDGIVLDASNDSDIISNSFEYTDDAVVIDQSHRANVSLNTMTSGIGRGVFSGISDNVTISHNEFGDANAA
ncbi:MAG: right-handed parallel beta-helix repeat-containing protein, partial [Candidatus Thorarchaeota archaeon]|nr:right-handed parallel beta-helix repeat-containing protein [Candidatus Thorarchaeota archaeon]